MKLSNTLGSAFDGSTQVLLACMWQLQQRLDIPSSQGCLRSWMEEMTDGERWAGSEKSGKMPKRYNRPPKWKTASHATQNKVALMRPSETLSHQHYRPSQTSSGAHLSIRRNTLTTPQLLPAGMGTARLNLPTGICKKGRDEDDSPG